MRSLPPGPPQQETLMRCMFGSPVVLFFFSTEVLSHAYSNGHRGVPKDPIEASFCTELMKDFDLKRLLKSFN